MAFEFDGINKIITCTVGTTAIDVKDLYSRWKDWTRDDDGSKYTQAFTIVGGELVNEATSTYVATYIFLMNGWKIRPQEANHTVQVSNGILLTDEGEDPFIPTLGSYNVQVKYSQPMQAQSVIIETGVSGLTESESVQLALIEKALRKSQFIALK